MAESEIDVGIQPVMDFSSPFAPPSARVFLSDALENGAGTAHIWASLADSRHCWSSSLAVEVPLTIRSGAPRRRAS